jgi:exonuclease III
MPSSLPNDIPQALPTKIRTAQINAENLFLFFDEELPSNWKTLSEKDWQRLSKASVQNKSLKKTLWLGQSLSEIDADFILVNEVGGEESLANFSRYFLDDKYSAHIIEGNSNRGIDIGYLVRKTLRIKVELRTHKQRPIDFLYPHDAQNNSYFQQTAPEKMIKSHFFSRDCAELRVFKKDADDPALIFLLVHLKSKLDPDGIDPEGRERRGAELKALMSIYKELRQEFANIPVVVGGDFNGIAKRSGGEKEFLPIFEADLENTAYLIGLDAADAMTQIQFYRNQPPSYLQIDYLFISPELHSKLIKEESYVYRYRSDLGVKLALPTTLDQRLVLPSDHYPVVATFKDIF